MHRILVCFIVLTLGDYTNSCFANEKPLIFPLPLEVQQRPGKFIADSSTVILIPGKETKADAFLSGLIRTELIDKYEHPLRIVRRSAFSPKEKVILVGALTNPLVRTFCADHKYLSVLKGLGDEGYILSVSENTVVVAGNTDKAALLGWSSLRQLILKGESPYMPQLFVRDAPVFPFRALRMFLPGRENISFFKRFIKDFVSLYKYNTLILEFNANMRLDRHPELNIGSVQFERHLTNSRLGRPPGPHQEFQNSSHQDNADGDILEKEEVADLLAYIRRFNIDVIPEIPSLTHAYYLLFGHKELAENIFQEYPDTYCPLKQGSYELYFDVLDEYIEVIKPSMIHIGHDEWRMEKDLCQLCRGKDYGKLFADDVNRIYQFLAKKGIKTGLWGDHLLESVRKKDHQVWKTSTGYTYKIPGAVSPDLVRSSIPKDILVFNWFWNKMENDQQLADFGFRQAYGNLRADIKNWSDRRHIKGVIGGAPSSWAASTEKNIGKDHLYEFLSAANLLWSSHYMGIDSLGLMIEPMIHGIRRNLSGKLLPSEMNATIQPVDISSLYNASLKNELPNGRNIHPPSGKAGVDNLSFHIATSEAGREVLVAERNAVEIKTIPVNSDVSSLIFLHACTMEGSNVNADFNIYNFDETAQLLGWYEVIFEDGFIETIPVRYGVNILDWRWRQRIKNMEKPKDALGQNKYAYQARAVSFGTSDPEPVTFFSFEWQNSRYGKKITGVRLKAVNDSGEIKNNIVLLAISKAEHKTGKNAAGQE